MGGRGSRRTTGEATAASLSPAQQAAAPVQVEAVDPLFDGPIDVSRVEYDGSKYVAGKTTVLAEMERKMFGKEISREDYGLLVGAPAGSKVRVTWNERDQFINVIIRHEKLGIFASRDITKDAAGKTVLSNRFFEVASTGQGVGTKVFARSVDNARRLGIDRITTKAARTKTLNGYYTWARLGYDAPIPNSTKGKAVIAAAQAAGLGKVATVHDLMSKPGGSAIWKQHGLTFAGKFDLNPSSTSSRVLDEYKKSKGIK